MNPKVDFYFEKNTAWQKEIEKMRKIALSCGLGEELKWGCPCYTYNGANIVLIHVFKEYCAYLFFKGALMNDPDKLLIRQTENVQSARQIRFTNVKEVTAHTASIKAYIYEAIEIEKAGLKVKLKKTSDFKVPEEFQKILDKNSRLKNAFGKLTPGRQRAYLFFFSQPKQSQTRISRIEKYKLQILNGRGLNDD